MGVILGAQVLALWLFRACLLTSTRDGGHWFPSKTHLRKRKVELWFLGYGVIWISGFFVIVATEVYERFDAFTYVWVCLLFALPLYLQPIVLPSLTGDEEAPVWERYSLKANAWLAVFGFTGNYWYTHYFYSVLDAAYTMPSYRLNDVPVPMWFATHFFFCFYHALSNCVIRKILTGHEPSSSRRTFLVLAIGSLSYATAFAETFFISRFPYWTFKDRDLAYTLGSAFYGLYFVVSFPAFYVVDELPESVVDNRKTTRTHSLPQTLVEALAASMAVLYLLDFTRVAVAKRDLTVPAQPTLFLRS